MSKLRRRHKNQRRIDNKKLFHALENHLPPTEVLDQEGIIAIHNASLRVLEETGVEMWEAEARSILRAAGAKVDETAQRVWLERGLVEEMVAKAPSHFTMVARDPAKNITVGGNHILFGAVGGPPFVTDLDRGRRDGNLADLQTLNKLIQQCDAITLGGGHLIEPLDVSAPIRHLESTYYDITLLDKVPRATVFGGDVTQDVITLMAISHAGASATIEETLAGLRQKAVVMGVINVNSPLRYDGPMLEGLLRLVRHHQVPIITPFIMVGAVSPVTMPAAIMQQNAEVLAGVTLAQIVNPGCPVVYGGFVTPLDMQSGAVPFGTPEAAWALFAGAQLARYYNLPFRSSGGLTTAQVPDAQAAYESLFGLWPAVMAHTNLITQAAGWLDGGLVASFEKFILDVEMIERFYAICQAQPVTEETLAVDYIHQVGPGGHHLDTDHTLARYRTAFHHSPLSSRLPYETWVEQGQPDTAQRANQRWKALLAEYEPPPIEPGIIEALQAYKQQRQEVLLK